MKNSKINLILLLCIMAVSISSCKKDKKIDNPLKKEYYAKFKLDGTQKEFRDMAIAVFDEASGNYGVTMEASPKILALDEWISFVITVPEPIVVGKEYQINITENQICLITYFYGGPTGEPYSTSVFSGKNSAKIKFNEITDKYVRGVFSGNLLDNDDIVRHTITDGEFYLERLKKGL